MLQNLTAAESSTVPMTLTVPQPVKVTETAQRRNLAAITRGEIFASCDRRYSKKTKHIFIKIIKVKPQSLRILSVHSVNVLFRDNNLNIYMIFL